MSIYKKTVTHITTKAKNIKHVGNPSFKMHRHTFFYVAFTKPNYRLI